MRITNDTITFDAADFDGLSDFAKKALQSHLGERRSPLGVFEVLFEAEAARVLNEFVTSAKASFVRKTGEDPEIANLVRRLAAADPATRAAVQPAIDDLEAALAGVVAPGPEVPVVDAGGAGGGAEAKPEEPGFFAKAKDFLGL